MRKVTNFFIKILPKLGTNNYCIPSAFWKWQRINKFFNVGVMTPDVNLTLISDNSVPEVMLLSSVSVVWKLNTGVLISP